jgi:hypothetical protein
MLFESEGYVIKGFADAVATRGDIACLIDFKSSRDAALSEKTKVQLLSYCASINDQYPRIFYASHVIGSTEAMDFIAFDDDAFSYLKQTVSSVLDDESSLR